MSKDDEKRGYKAVSWKGVMQVRQEEQTTTKWVKRRWPTTQQATIPVFKAFRIGDSRDSVMSSGKESTNEDEEYIVFVIGMQ